MVLFGIAVLAIVAQHRVVLLHEIANAEQGEGPPVVLCRDGASRLAVRRERPDELLAREVGLFG